MPTEEEIEILGRKLQQLKLAYDQYFLGSRPREPIMLRDEVHKIIVAISNQPIQNTAMRFKFNSIMSRYQSFKRQWTETLRQIEQGTYHRHQFRAGLRDRKDIVKDPEPAPTQDRGDVYDAYVEARRSCGQSVANLTPAKLDAILDKQLAAVRKRYGDSEVRFKVVVEQGKAKLKVARAG